jgi:predicted Zn-dependent peptidase
VILGISGDFNKEQLIAKVNALFGGWSPAEVSFPRVEDEKPMSVHSVNYIYKDVNQSNILMGHMGIRRHNPDEIAVEIMNYILGWGGFTSKLWKEVRQDRGLAYDVFGGITAGLDYGVFEAGCQTSGRTTCEAITVIRDVITEMTESPPSDAELALAKEGRLNRFVFNFASTAQIVRQRVTLEFLGYPLDYLDTYEAKIAAVTRDDVHRVATTYLHPDRLVVLVVGNSAQFDKPLSTLGEVNAIEIPRNAASSALMERTVPVFGYAPPSTLLFARIQR